MNERIKELAVQSGAGEWGDSVIAATMDIEKFAELIVRECAEVVQEGRWMVPPTQEQLARSIKRHFGVEG